MVDPIDGTRAFIAGRQRMDGLAGGRRGRPAGGGGAGRCRRSRPRSMRSAGGGAYATASGSGRAPRETLAGATLRQQPRRYASAVRDGGRDDGPPRFVPSLAYRIALVAAGRDRRRHRQAERAGLGPCGCRSFGARSRGAACRPCRPGVCATMARETAHPTLIAATPALFGERGGSGQAMLTGGPRPRDREIRTAGRTTTCPGRSRRPPPTAPSGFWRRTRGCRRHPLRRSRAGSISSASIPTTHRLRCLEGEGAGDGRQRPDALFHRPSPSPARSRGDAGSAARIVRRDGEFGARGGEGRTRHRHGSAAAPSKPPPRRKSAQASARRRRSASPVDRLFSAPVQRGIASLAANYLRLVNATSPLPFDPPDPFASYIHLAPVIFTMWHGQHFMLPFARIFDFDARVLISRHHRRRDQRPGREKLGVKTIRGSTARDPSRMMEKGGIVGFLEMKAALEEGACVSMTADISNLAAAPRRPRRRVAGAARAAGRSSRIAYATSRRIDVQELGPGDHQPAVQPRGLRRRRAGRGAGGRRCRTARGQAPGGRGLISTRRPTAPIASSTGAMANGRRHGSLRPLPCLRQCRRSAACAAAPVVAGVDAARKTAARLGERYGRASRP